jgi:hypothetical protein
MGARLLFWPGVGSAGFKAGDAWVDNGGACSWESLIAEEYTVVGG